MSARYAVVTPRPDLCAASGLRDPRAYRFDGRWYVQGRDGRGRWRLFAETGGGLVEAAVDLTESEE